MSIDSHGIPVTPLRNEKHLITDKAYDVDLDVHPVTTQANPCINDCSVCGNFGTPFCEICPYRDYLTKIKLIRGD